MKLVAVCYRLSAGFPRSEEFGLRSQLRRSAISIASNIAEGHGRGTTGEYAHSLSVAHGSLMELETQLQIAEQLGYIRRADLVPVLEQCAEVGRMVNALARRLKSRLANRP